MALTNQERQIKAANLRVHHQLVLDSLGVPNAKYIPKCAYRVGGKLVMGFFPSELQGSVDIYTERVDSQLKPEDEHIYHRELLKWEFNPEWDISFPTKQNGHILIPVDEMKVVPALKAKSEPKVQSRSGEIQKPKITSGSVDIEDSPISELTIRDLYAMLTDTPFSNKSWLNDLIDSRSNNLNINSDNQ